jgi:hypothetical protein
MPRLPLTASVLFLAVLFATCNHKDRQVNRGIYHWRNTSYIDNELQVMMKQHSIKRLYIKLMDINWYEERGPSPDRINHLEELGPNIFIYDSTTFDVVPVIFITNKTFVHIDSADIPLLAKRILRKCFSNYDEIDSTYEHQRFDWFSKNHKLHTREIQFDCDWTEKTAKKYFYFLETVRKFLPGANIKISATIRLHQFKYPAKTGVPPVDRGMLMVYNITDVTKYTSVNSIFEYDKAKPYFTGKEYPLPLDLALAAYSWGVVYRDKKFFTLENGMISEMLQEKEYFQLKEKNMYAVRKDTLLKNLFLRPGDEIKIEGIDEKKLMQAAQLARRALNDDSLTVTFFELSSPTLKNYRHETIEQIYNSFR